MGKRKDIYDALQTALNASTGINHVTIDVSENPWDWKGNKFPGVRIYDGEEQITRLSFLDATADDMESEIPFEFIGYVRKLTSNTATTDSIDRARNDLMVDVEKALTQNAAIDVLVKDITPQERDTDRGYSDGIGWSNGIFKVMYHYNHLSP